MNPKLIVLALVLAAVALELELLGCAYYLGVKGGIETIQSLLAK